MTEVMKDVAKTRRSVMGESLAGATDPIGSHQLKQEEKGTTAAALAASEAAAVAEALAAAEAERAGTSLIDPLSPEQMPTGDTQRAARRKASARNLARRGRASTILTSYDDALGGET